MDAYDADILIYAARNDDLGTAALNELRRGVQRMGSVILLPEVLSRPLRNKDEAEHEFLVRWLSQIDLKPVDEEIAEAATTLGAKYRLKVANAIHLATAVVWGAERFHTNNRRDFDGQITEVEVVYLAQVS